MTMRSTNIFMPRRRTARCLGRRSGFTLIEMLISVTLTLMLMYGVAQIFSVVGNSVNDSRSLLNITDRLRATRARLELDLDGITAPMLPPLSPGDGLGYFELIEGPVGPTIDITERVKNIYDPDRKITTALSPDTTAIDYDDILIFTTRTMTSEPFVGKASGSTIESRFAEVAWFVRGRNLYRRVRVIRTPVATPVPFAYLSSTGSSFENKFDISARHEGDPTDPTTWNWVYNSLGDLTKRENRMYHVPILPTDPVALQAYFPFNLHDNPAWQILGLPTLAETSSYQWMLAKFGGVFPVSHSKPTGPLTFSSSKGLSPGTVDPWNEPYPYVELDPITGNLTDYHGLRANEDVILTNVIGFDVKVWDPKARVLAFTSSSGTTTTLEPGDPGYETALSVLDETSTPTSTTIREGAFVDIGYGVRTGQFTTPPSFSGAPHPKSGFLDSTSPTKSVFIYDTGSTHYEDGGPAHNGLDDDGDGIVDDPDEQITSPPYPIPLTAIKITIRVFEPDSRQVREITILHDFSKK